VWRIGPFSFIPIQIIFSKLFFLYSPVFNHQPLHPVPRISQAQGVCTHRISLHSCNLFFLIELPKLEYVWYSGAQCAMGTMLRFT
jgi:hypothetical protein